MLRRRKDDTLNGKRLIELPKRTVEIVSCPFDVTERAFYASLETKMSETLEKLMNSDKGNKYMSVLLLLLRLRQGKLPRHTVIWLLDKSFEKHVIILFSSQRIIGRI